MLTLTRRKFFKLIAFLGALLNLPFLAKFSTGNTATDIVTDIQNPAAGSREQDKQNKPTVVRSWSTKLSSAQSLSGNYFNLIDQDVVNRCMDRAVCGLTGRDDVAQAWADIIGNYEIGQKIVLRTNFNPADKSEKVFFDDIIVAPQIINNVILSLHSSLNVPFKDIIIYELTRPIPYNLIRKYIQYPVTYVEKPSSSFIDKVKNKLKMGLAAPDFDYPIEMREEISDNSGNRLTCYLPKVVTQADHLINLSVFKYHQFGLLSGLLKNHYGTVRFSNLSHYPLMMHDDKVFKCTVDLNRHPLIQKLTRLNIVDSIFGAYDYKPGTQVKKEWKTFGNLQFPLSIFMGLDAVAVESVLHSYLLNERESHGLATNHPNYLEDAQSYNLGVFENTRDLDFKKIRYLQYDESAAS
jgi:hypothetical protein